MPLIAVLFAAIPSVATRPTNNGLPRLMLWVWERPEDLRFIDPRTTGVAYLAESIYLKNGHARVRPRFQPLQIPSATQVVAVVRIDVFGEQPLDPAQRAKVVQELLAIARRPGLSGLQIDFDARVSQRQFYRDLLEELRPQMPHELPLSITALASWCNSDPWIIGLPVEHAIPMFFRMGADAAAMHSLLRRDKVVEVALCEGSVGISLDEPLPRFPKHDLTYVFSPSGWDRERVRQAVEEAHR